MEFFGKLRSHPQISLLVVLWTMGLGTFTLRADDAYAAAHCQPVVALLSDFGWQDTSVGELKGTILTVNPAARIEDVSHSITPFNLVQGAFMLDRAASEFPTGYDLCGGGLRARSQ